MKPVIYVRADGSHQIGLGHLVRCLALAYMVKDNFDVVFACHSAPDRFSDQLTANGFGFIQLKDETEFFDKIRSEDLVIIDGYHFDTTYHDKVRTKASASIVIDDLHNQPINADLVINHAPGINPGDYRTPPYTQFALGPSYALLRPAFLKQAQNKRVIKSMANALICFGGSDNQNLTKSTLQTVLDFADLKKIVVITGSAYRITNELLALIAADSRVHHLHDLDEDAMLEQMANADLAIVPASGILLEALAVGCHVISGMYTENQKFTYNNYKNAGAFEDAGDFSQSSLSAAITNTIKFHKPVRSLIDGKSGQRLGKQITSLADGARVHLRKATESDLAITYQWARSPVVRAYSFNQQEITKDEHSAWFIRKVKEETCFYFIAELNENAIGSIRFDIKSDEAIISYLVDPAFHGQNLGLTVLRKGIEALMTSVGRRKPAFDVITGWVMKANVPSVKAFERLGFSKIEESDKFKFQKVLT